MAISTMTQKEPPVTMVTPIKRAVSLSPSVITSFSSRDHQRKEPTLEDYERVAQLMDEQRLADGNRRSGNFNHKEASPVLSKLAQGLIPDATPGIVQALLDWGADVSIEKPKSTNFFKVLSGKDQVEKRSNVLEHATENCSVDILIVLAQEADEQAINQALPVALRLADPIKTSILLAKGANATPHCNLFLQCIDSAPIDMVILLLRDVKGACADCKNKGLVRAAKAGNVEKANLLMDKGADPSFDGSSALFEALRRGEEQVALAIISRPEVRNNKPLLNTAAQCAQDHGHHRLLKACLDAASKQPDSKEPVASVQDLVVTGGLLEQGSPAASNIEIALRSAVNAGNLEAIQQLLLDNRSGNLSKNVMESALCQAADTPDLKIAYRLIDMLLSTNLRGDGVTQSLCLVLSRPIPPANENDRLQIINLLLEKGRANINACKGSAVLQSLSPGRSDILRLILQHGPSTDTLVMAIEEAMKLEAPGARLVALQLLVEGGDFAQNDYLQCAAVAAASRAVALDVLKYLAGFITSPTTFNTGLGALVKDGNIWMSPEGLYVVQFLLDHGAHGPNVDDAIVQAATRYSREAVQLLATSTNLASLDKILSAVLKSSSGWQHSDNLWLIHSFLEWGCKGSSVNEALIVAVNIHVEGHNVDFLVDTLLHVGAGADVNDQRGKALQIAASRGDTSLLKRLTSNGVGRLALTNAFQAIITSNLDEGTALTLLDILIAAGEQSRTRFDVDAVLPDGRSPLEACLSTHPKAEKLTRYLLRLGCKVETLILFKVDSDEEWVPLLVWGLYQSSKAGLAPPVLAALVDAHPYAVNFRSKSGVTPLIAAVQLGLNHLVGKLLEAGAKPGDRDNTGHTALYFAASGGNMAVVQALVQAKAAPNDGSLHEAARNMHKEVVETLIKAKHETNFPSSLHEGRTALQELCYRCNCGGISPQLEDTIRALEKGKADPFATHMGRNALFLALENRRPYHITKAFLDIQMWRYINHESNVFVYAEAESSAEYVYSATMYLKHNLYRGNVDHVPQLLRLLTEKSCKDRFFLKFKPHQLDALQPAGAVGVPQALADEDTRRRVEQERRRTRDRDHTDKLRREQEEAVHRAEIEGRQHQLRLERQQQTSMLQAAMATKQVEARNARRQSQQFPAPMAQNNVASGQHAQQKRLQRHSKAY